MGGGSKGGGLRGRTARARPSSARTGAGGVAQFVGGGNRQASTVNRGTTFRTQTLGSVRGRTARITGRAA